MFFKEGRRPTDDAAAAFAAKTPEQHRADLERADPRFAGQQALWRGKPREVPVHFSGGGALSWLAGWDAAALQAARTLAEHRPMITHAAQIRSALRDAGTALRLVSQQWTKRPPTLGIQINAAAMAINTALVHSAPGDAGTRAPVAAAPQPQPEPAAQTDSAAIDAPPGSAPARRESPAPTESGGAPGGASTDGSACPS